MNIRLVTSLREFDALAPIWREITSESGQTSPFLSHDWFACCWRTAGPDRRRELWIVEDGAGPLGLVPLVRWRTRIRGLPVRMIQFLDSPDTPFADFPAAGRLEEVVTTFLTALRSRSDWDVLSLHKLPAESPALKILEAVLPGQFPWQVVRTERSPYLRVAGSWDDFFRGQSPRFRKTCRSLENRLRRSGVVSVEEHRDVDPEGALFEEVMEVSRLSWKGPRALAMATMPGMPRFFRELTRRASENGWLHLWLLRLDGRAVATEYQIRSGRRLHALRADFDQSVAHLSPGAGLNLQIIRALFERRGVEEYDMGPGANSYKLRWATSAREVLGLQIYAATPYGRLLHGIETRLVPMAQRWRERMRELCG